MASGRVPEAMRRLIAAPGSQIVICMIPSRQLFDRIARFIHLLALLCILLPALLMPARHASAQMPATVDTEALRRRDEDADQERRQRQQAPAARLLPEPEERDTHSKPLPVDASCLPVQRIVLTLPERLPAAVREAGLRHLAQGPFQPAQACLEQYQGQCLGPSAIGGAGSPDRPAHPGAGL
jgi:hemolysin activation/secretion protein